ncbi:MAG: ParB N-terminal domain-containing protein [Candidatus Omnitrophica bacterium]|nr:ParB N-terminal domain-containing protein [Candidatus Omnitrophota bacterium]
MERNVITKVRVCEIPVKQNYCLRYRIEDPVLQDSIQKYGLITPVLMVRDEEGIQVLSGHRRLNALRRLGEESIDGIAVDPKWTKKDLFYIALLSNWNQSWTDLDRAFCLGRAAHEFGISKDESLSKVLPLLGIPGEIKFYETALKSMTLEACVLDRVAEQKVPYRVIRYMHPWTKEDQILFSSEIAGKIHLSLGEFRNLVQWMGEISREAKSPLGDWLREINTDSFLESEDLDCVHKGDRLYLSVRRKRFPNLTEQEREFQKVAGDIHRDLREISLEPPQSFEETGYVLKARVQDRNALDKVLKELITKKNKLNSLFDVLL